MKQESDEMTRSEGRHPLRILTAGVVLTAVIFGIFSWYVLNTQQVIMYHATDDLRLQKLRGIIPHLDEILTMSARMAAATGDIRWEERYRQFEPALDAAIKDAIGLASDVRESESAAQTDAANLALVKMENEAFTLVRQGRREAALKILFSDAYEKQKQIYTSGMEKFGRSIEQHLQGNAAHSRQHIVWLKLLMLVAFVSLVPGWIIVSIAVRNHLKKRILAEKALENAYRDIELRVVQRTNALAQTNHALEAEITEHRQAEEKLRESEEHLAATLRSIGDGVIACDADGNVVSINGVAETLTGWGLDEARGRPIADIFRIIHIETLQEAEIPVERAMREGRTIGIANHTALIARDGTEHQIADSCAPIRDAAGGVIGAVLIFRDVTEDYRRRERLRERVKELTCLQNIRLAVHGDVSIDQACRGILAHLVAGMQFPEIAVPVITLGRQRFAGSGWVEGLAHGLHGDIRERGELSGRVSVFYTQPKPFLPEEQPLIDAVAIILGQFLERRGAERALQKSRDQYRSLVFNIPGIVYRCALDKDWMMLYMGANIDQISGYPAGDFINNAVRTYESIIHREDTGYVDRSVNEAIESGKPWEIEYRICHKDGSIRWAYEKGRGVLGEEGNVEFLDGFILDITERKQAELAVWDREQRLNLALQGGDLGTWDWNLLTEEVIFSDQWANMKGYDTDEIEPHFSSWSKMIHPEDLPKIQEILNAYLEGETPAYEAEFRMRHKSGQWLWILDRGKIIQRDADGKPIRVCGTHMDVTERKTFEQRLADERRRLGRVIEGTHAGTWEWNVQTGETIFNETWAEIVGYSLDELAPVSIKTWEALAHPEDMQKSGELMEQHFSGELPFYDCQCRMKHKDGHWIWVHDRGRVITRTDDGKPLMMFGTHMDITKAKRAEEDLLETNRQLEEATALANRMAADAAVANMAKSEFLANMSHEIRTPMNGVIGMTGLLLDTNLTDEQHRYAEIVRASGESLLALINDILDFSKIEANKLDLEILNFDLQGLLEDFAATLALQAHEKGLELVCGISPEVPVLLRGDPGRLRQVLTNLAGNAVKFTSGGEVAIRVSVDKELDDTGNLKLETRNSKLETEKQSPQVSNSALLRFSVRDTGIGIPRDKVGLIFGKFSQADASTTRRFGGSGLGLAISKQLAEMMGGEIGVESEEGKGSEFWFTVCLEKQPEGTIIEKPLPVDLCDVRVLIVDDNATNREILNTRMTSWGMRVSETGDGPEALDSLYKALDENDPFRVAVIDMQMPGMDGEALGRAIKADSRLADTRMVILTSLGVRGDARRFAEIGFDAYLTKPARTLELKAVLSQVLSEHENEMMDLNTIFTRHTARETMNLFAGRKARILLAEDNFTNQQVALGILKKLGLSAEAVANGVEAVKALESIPYDLVLMDIQMPEMDGIAATREIRNLKLENRNPEGQVSSIPHPGSSVPIIAMTAHAMAGDREKCLKAGMNGYVSKPVSPRALAEALEKWLPPPGKSVKEEGEDVPSKLVEDPGSDDGTRVSIALPGLAGEGRIFDTQPSAHVFDKAALMSRLMSDVDLGRSVIGVFLEDMPKQISELKSLIGQGEAKQAGAQAHKIKGAAANIGGVALQQVAFEMEKAGKARNLDAVEMGMIELEKEFRRLKETMEREF